MRQLGMLVLLLFSVGICYAQQEEKANYFDDIKKLRKAVAEEKQRGKKQKGYSMAKQLNRWDWFWRTRAGAEGDYMDYARALEASVKKRLEAERNTSKSTLWQSLGPVNSDITNKQGQAYIGRINAVWCSPNNPDIIMVGSVSGGLHKTNNGGQTWTDLTPDIPVGVLDICVNPNDENKIYIATGNTVNGQIGNGKFGFGIYYSADGGNTWIPKNTGFPAYAHINDIEMETDKPENMYCIVNQYKIYKTTDGGNTWNRMLYTSLKELTQLQFQKRLVLLDPLKSGITQKILPPPPTKTDILYASGDRVLVRYKDNTWTDLTGQITSSDGKIGIDIPNGSATIYAASPDGIYLSNDFGTTWNSIVNSTGHYAPWAGCAELYVVNSDVIFYGSMLLYNFSAEGIDSIKAGHADVRSIYPISSTSFYCGTDGGLVKVDYVDKEFIIDVNKNGNLALNQAYSLDITTESTPSIFMGTHDCGTMRYMHGDAWRHVLGGDGGTTCVDYTDNNVVFAQSGSGSPNTIIRTANGLETNLSWGFVTNIIDYDPPLIQDPYLSSTFYLGDWNVYYSDDGGNSFSANNKILTTDGRVSALDVGYSYLYAAATLAASGKTILRRCDRNSGAHIANLIDMPGLPTNAEDYSINCIELHPFNDSKIWIGFTTLGGGQKVYFSENRGESWMDFSDGLPYLPVNDMLYDKATGYLYAGTDAGVYVKNGYHAWELFGVGLPICIVSKLRIAEHTRELYVSTYGRGVWKVDLPELDESIEINSLAQWNNNTHNGDININNGGTLILSGTLDMLISKHIYVHSGGKLIINGGRLEDAEVIVYSGGYFEITNEGTYQKNLNGGLVIKNGATFEHNEGIITIE